LEAEASGKPVVAFNVSGVVEAVRNGETGMLVQSGNSAALAEALSQLLSDVSLRECMGKKGRSLVQNHYTWNQCANKMLNVYQDAIELTRPC
jgi:glycosyltransferase involved in cell wall biosynthesis